MMTDAMTSLLVPSGRGYRGGASSAMRELRRAGTVVSKSGQGSRPMPSSVIRQFDYDPDHTALDVTFVSGRRYRYFQVPPMLAERFRRAASKGQFFNARIRNRFDYKELAGSRTIN
jgi:lysyl-tRNA synthetase class 2